MKIWVDADACPKVIKEILYRAAERKKLSLILVANHQLSTPPSHYIKSMQVPRGFDIADTYIVQQLAAGDLVITADIPLADDVIGKGAQALNPRGELYTKDNIRQRLVMRDFMEEMRGTGLVSGGPPTLSQSDRRAFANQLDHILLNALGN